MINIDKYLRSYLGDIGNIERYNGGYLLKTKEGNFFMAKRDYLLSNPLAIKQLSQYGISPALFIGKDYILEEFRDFDKEELTNEELAILLKDIHANKNEKGVLVHGDYSRFNTTKICGHPKCFDYEFSHYGDSYRDLGRIILRECDSEEEVIKFFEVYGRIPSLDNLKKGFSGHSGENERLKVSFDSGKYSYNFLEVLSNTLLKAEDILKKNCLIRLK
jgi:hypothetical protein